MTIILKQLKEVASFDFDSQTDLNDFFLPNHIQKTIYKINIKFNDENSFL